MLVLLFFGDGLGLKWVDMFVLCHINEHFTTCSSVFGLHNEALFRLYDSATFRVDVWFAIWGTFGCCGCRQLLKHLLHFWRGIS